MSIRSFVDEQYLHFNAGVLRRAARSLTDFLDGGGRMFLTLAGAMSTAEIGRTLAPLIRAGHVAGISCTGANLEEDIFNLVAHDHYESIEDWRNLCATDEAALLARHQNRVTDTCIPEHEAFRRIESFVMRRWREAGEAGVSHLPHEYFYSMVRSGELEPFYEADPANSWVAAAAEAELPLFVPGWEDSTLGNIFAARVMEGEVKSAAVSPGFQYMIALASFYSESRVPLAFFQIGGGIAGDFPICVVPMLHQDLERQAPLWAWFCQISEATPSYGGYSGAPPNEKITWGKLDVDTPKFVIESDATIVAPLMFGYILDL